MQHAHLRWIKVWNGSKNEFSACKKLTGGTENRQKKQQFLISRRQINTVIFPHALMIFCLKISLLAIMNPSFSQGTERQRFIPPSVSSLRRLSREESDYSSRGTQLGHQSSESIFSSFLFTLTTHHVVRQHLQNIIPYSWELVWKIVA